MLNIHRFQSGYELFTTLCIVGDSDLADIYEYLTWSRGSHCKNESIVIVSSGNWEHETGLLAIIILNPNPKPGLKFTTHTPKITLNFQKHNIKS